MIKQIEWSRDRGRERQGEVGERGDWGDESSQGLVYHISDTEGYSIYCCVSGFPPPATAALCSGQQEKVADLGTRSSVISPLKINTENVWVHQIQIDCIFSRVIHYEAYVPQGQILYKCVKCSSCWNKALFTDHNPRVIFLLCIDWGWNHLLFFHK